MHTDIFIDCLLTDHQGDRYHPLLQELYFAVKEEALTESYFQLPKQQWPIIKQLAQPLQSQYIWLLIAILLVRDQGHTALALDTKKLLDHQFFTKQFDNIAKLWFDKCITRLEEINDDTFRLLPAINYHLLQEINHPQLLKIVDLSQINNSLIDLQLKSQPPTVLYALTNQQQTYQIAFSGYFKLEQQVKNLLLSRNDRQKTASEQTSLNLLFATLDQYNFFPYESEQQKNAVLESLQHKLAIILGGPGTGKTTTVRKLILLNSLLWYIEKRKLPIIALTAPTGKASKRLLESVNNNLPNVTEQIRQLINLHNHLHNQQPALDADLFINHLQQQFQLSLSLHSQVKYPRVGIYSRNNPLPIDILVIDEASMIGLSLFHYTLTIMSEDSQLIIMGDANQLPSVDLGTVMAAISQQRYFANSKLHDKIKELTQNFRSAEAKSIAALATAIAEDRANKFLQQYLNQSTIDSNLQLHIYPANVNPKQQINKIIDDAQHWFEEYYHLVNELYLLYKKQVDLSIYQEKIKQLFSVFKQNRLLLANNSGIFGIQNFNNLLQHRLANNFFNDKISIPNLGKPIQINKNQANGLVNGDLCLILPQHHSKKTNHTTDSADQLMLWVERNDKLETYPAELTIDYDIAYSITVHKSQGDEFFHTILILPMELTLFHSKEIFYTAITRAKHKLTIYAPAEILHINLENIAKQSTLNYSWE